MNHLEIYLSEISKSKFVLKQDIFWDFLEISDFKHNKVVKIKEAWV